MSDDKAKNDAPDASTPEITVESALELAKRAFALKKFEQAVDHYATALELMSNKYAENAPEMADLYFSYGKALLENAISQASVLGKEQPEGPEGLGMEASSSNQNGNGNGPILSFSGDAEDEPLPVAEDGTIDLFAEATAREEPDSGDDGEGEAEGEGEGGEPEDDFNAAWEVLDLARALYEKGKDDDDEVKLKLADTYIALGDLSLETEKFDQAIIDFSAGLKLKTELLPISSRQIAEAHYKLSIVLDLTSGRLADAIDHAVKALESVEYRLAELRDGLNNQLPPMLESQNDGKGKGKAVKRLARDECVQNMSRTQMEAEIKEVEGLKEELALKVEELKTTPTEPAESAPALVAKELDKELNAGIAPPIPQAVNDLTSMVVKKKKKEPEMNGTAKRKLEEESTVQSEKRARAEDPPSSSS